MSRLTTSVLAAAASIRDDLRSGAARERRIAAGASGAEMARAARVTPQALFQWETGQSVPTVAHALAYGKALAALTSRGSRLRTSL